jgi:ABC transporter substrate binding protein (PQQ-dependent alcohol dehydrogenase system)
MYRDASALLSGTNVKEVVAWHPSLTRFGADTLNKRFQNRFGRPMTAEGWAAWMSVKIIWEASLSVKSGEARAIAAHLERETTKFDGHKGQPLSFRPWDHQLRQPVYATIIDGEGAAQMVRELPDQAAVGSTRDALDRLGESAATSSCRFAR